jgi:hypothetical protein
MNLKLNFSYTPFKRIILSDGTNQVEVKFNRPIFYLVKRGTMEDSIDQGLKRRAEELGVKFYFNSKRMTKDVHIVATGPKKPVATAKGISFETSMNNVAIGLINEKAAYNGYSYLLVSKGYGCMCTVVFGKVELVNKCFEETKNIFSKLVDLDMKNQLNVGGCGYFNYKPTLSEDDKLYVGEAAGLQDAFLGFGMRYAITSGYLAAKSIVEGKDYEKLIEERFSKQLKASVVNRFLWERLCGKISIDKIKSIKNLFQLLFEIYNFSFRFQKLLFPIALIKLKREYRNLLE